MPSRRPRRSPQRWTELIAEFRAGNEDEIAFCKRHQLGFHSFRKHKYAANAVRRRIAKTTPSFKEIVVEPRGLRDFITVRSPSGLVLELPSSTDANTVVNLVRVLHRGH